MHHDNQWHRTRAAMERTLPSGDVGNRCCQSAIADAHKALLDRIKETLTKPVSAERQELSDALNGLRSLRQELNVSPRQTSGGGTVLRKTG